MKELSGIKPFYGFRGLIYVYDCIFEQALTEKGCIEWLVTELCVRYLSLWQL